MCYTNFEVKKMNVGEKIRKYRKERGLTQKQLADILGVSEGMISQYEAKKELKFKTIQKIAKALEVSVFDIVEYSEVENEVLEDFKSGRKAFAEKWNKSYKQKKMNELMDQLNDKGQDKAIEHVEILTKVDEYKK